jgi:hypothetical protein
MATNLTLDIGPQAAMARGAKMSASTAISRKNFEKVQGAAF